jgi:hypothetical protein
LPEGTFDRHDERATEASVDTSSIAYAGFWFRLLAYAIDLALAQPSPRSACLRSSTRIKVASSRSKNLPTRC